VSVNSNGVQGDFGSYDPTISADGRYVAFHSPALRLVPGDTNGRNDVFVHDRQMGVTERVSVDSSGVEGNNDSYYGSISADGRYVAFMSLGSNLVSGDTNGDYDVFIHDRQLGTTERVSVDSGGIQGNLESWFPSVSADGRYVAFMSLASNLVPGDLNGGYDVFLRDRQSGTTERVSVGAQLGGGGFNAPPSISADGRYVAFKSGADDLVPGDTNRYDDIFIRDRQNSTTERMSVDSGGLEANDDSYRLSISADGSSVAFESLASNLVPGDTNGHLDIFVHDRLSGTTERASLAAGGAEGSGQSSNPSISEDGRLVAFSSGAPNLVPGDTNATVDVFLRDRFGGPSFTSLCEPGIGGVIACPCSNMPSGLGRGCDNSAATGGAILSASGGTYLSSDSLVFTTSGERPTALSIVLQGTTSPAAGIVYGQGVRCVGGTLKRLYTKNAVGGSITAPDVGAGEATVALRSGALGDSILAGQSRWYLVFYRDPTVLGGCPASSTFNATQTGRVDWSF
jgi:Tol biopolymer transport system component